MKKNDVDSQSHGNTLSASAVQGWQQELKGLWGEAVKLHEPMLRYTTFRIGGPAQALLIVQTVDDLCRAVLWARHKGLPYYVLGQGSNVLVADTGVEGLVIVNRCQNRRCVESAEGTTVFAEAGVGLTKLAYQVSAQGWSGLEWAAGIPGTLGGAIVGNAGAFGSDMSASLIRIEVLDGEGERRSYEAADLDFSYRSSRFKKEGGRSNRELIILAAELSLSRSDSAQTVERCREAVRLRQRSQPLDEPSAGCVFKNPPRDYAGRLIEAAGLKGRQIGGARFSCAHANFVVNVGQARARDVLALIDLARTEVRQQFSLELELEIECIGQPVQTAILERKAHGD